MLLICQTSVTKWISVILLLLIGLKATAVKINWNETLDFWGTGRGMVINKLSPVSNCHGRVSRQMKCTRLGNVQSRSAFECGSRVPEAAISAGQCTCEESIPWRGGGYVIRPSCLVQPLYSSVAIPVTNSWPLRCAHARGRSGGSQTEMDQRWWMGLLDDARWPLF